MLDPGSYHLSCVLSAALLLLIEIVKAWMEEEKSDSEGQKKRKLSENLVLRILMRRIRICCQNSLLTLGSMSLRGAKVRSLRATLVAQTREP